MRPWRFAILIGLTTWSCGGSGGSPTPATPPTTVPVSTVATIEIVGERGAQSFSPNPATVRQSTTFTWRNTDNRVHRIVLNDGSLDSGDIAPGASSPALRLDTDGANYHCAIHPGMIGSIGRATGGPPPCDGPYC